MKMPKFPQLADDAEYADLLQKLNERQAERATARGQHDIVLARIRERQAGPTPYDTSAADRLQAIALGKPITKQPEPDLVLLVSYESKLRDLDAAVEFLKSKMRAVASRISVKVCDDLKAHDRELARSVIFGVLQAREKISEYKTFIETLREAGITTHHLANALPYFMHSTDKFGPMAE